MGQRAKYGAPPYAGSLRREDPKYRRWPYWDREGYYMNIGKGLGELSELQVRLFYDLYENRQDEYNGPKWNQFTPESFDELYTDLSKSTSAKDTVLGERRTRCTAHQIERFSSRRSAESGS